MTPGANLKSLEEAAFLSAHPTSDLICLVQVHQLSTLAVWEPQVEMGTRKKEKTRKERQGKVGDGMNNVKTKGENFYRYRFNPLLSWFEEWPLGTLNLRMCKQVGQEGEDLEYVQGWKSATEC